MTTTSEKTVEALEAQLDQLVAAFARVSAEGQMLAGRDAERIEEKLERLHSQIMEVTPPVPMGEVYARLGGRDATPKEFAELAKYMLPPDGEG